MKRKLSILLLILTLMQILSACSENPDITSRGLTMTESTIDPLTVDVSVEDMIQAVREAYGDEYLPNTEIPQAVLETVYSLDMTAIEEMVGEMPLISEHPDQVIIIKAVDGRADEVEAKLMATRGYIMDGTLEYPSNMAKAKATKVVRHGNYVAFFLIGSINNDMGATEEERMDYAEAEVEKAVAAFDSFFN